MEVGQPTVVEDLQEDVPDRLAAFSNSSSSTTAEGIASESTRSGGTARLRRSCRRAVARETPVSGTRSCRSERGGSVEPKRNSASAFAISVLPVPVGPTKRKTPSGRVGSVTPGLDHRNPLDDAVDRVGLLEDACSKNVRTSSRGAARRDRGARAGVPTRRERREHVAAREAAPPLLVGLGGGRSQESKDVAGRRDPGKELLRQLE